MVEEHLEEQGGKVVEGMVEKIKIMLVLMMQAVG